MGSGVSLDYRSNMMGRLPCSWCLQSRAATPNAQSSRGALLYTDPRHRPWTCPNGKERTPHGDHMDPGAQRSLNCRGAGASATIQTLIEARPIDCLLVRCRPDRCRTGPTRAAASKPASRSTYRVEPTPGCPDKRLPLTGIRLPVGLAPALPNCPPSATKYQRLLESACVPGRGPVHH